MAQVVKQPDGTLAVIRKDGVRVPLPEKYHTSIEPLGQTTHEDQVRELQNFDPTKSGVTVGQRATLGTFISTPEESRRLAKSWGYEIAELPGKEGGWNYAVRLKAGDPWKPVDPDGLDVGDALDLIGSAWVGLFSGAGAAVTSPGIVTAAAGGAGGALVGEASRQAAGQMLGLTESFDPAGLAMETAAGAAGPFLAKGAGLAASAVSGTARAIMGGAGEATSAIIGTRSAPLVPSKAITQARARIKGFQRMMSVDDLGKRFVKIVKAMGSKKFQEKLDTEAALASAASNKITLDVKAEFEPIMNLLRPVEKKVAQKTSEQTIETATSGTRSVRHFGERQKLTKTGKIPVRKGGKRSGKKPVKPTRLDYELEEEVLGKGGRPGQGATGKSRAKSVKHTKRTVTKTVETKGTPVSEEARDLLFREEGLEAKAQGFMASLTTWLQGESLSKLPIDLANRLKLNLWERAAKAGAFDPERGFQPTEFSNMLEKVAQNIRVKLIDKMEASGYQSFRADMDKLAAKTRGLNTIKKHLGWGTGDDVKRGIRASQFLGRLYGKSTQGFLEALADMEKNFGMKSGSLVTYASDTRSLAKEFAKRGHKSLTGRALIAQNFGVAGAGGEARSLARFSAAGVPVGLGIGGAVASGSALPIGAGVALASPKVLLSATRIALKAGDVLEGAQSALATLPLPQKARILRQALGQMGASTIADQSVVREGGTSKRSPVKLTGL